MVDDDDPVILFSGTSAPIAAVPSPYPYSGGYAPYDPNMMAAYGYDPNAYAAYYGAYGVSPLICVRILTHCIPCVMT